MQVRWSGIPTSWRIFHSLLWAKGFGVVNKTEVDVFLELSCFFYNPKNVGNLTSGSSAFSKSSLNSSRFMYCWSLAWRILSLKFLRAIKKKSSYQTLILWFLQCKNFKNRKNYKKITMTFIKSFFFCSIMVYYRIVNILIVLCAIE